MAFLTRALSLLLFLSVTSSASAQPTGRIEGRVLNGSTREPIAAAQISVTGHTGDVWTDTDGKFVVTDVALGAHTVVVTRDGFAPLSQPVEITMAAPATLEFQLPAQISMAEGLTVVGRLSDYVDTSAAAARSSAALIDIPQAIVVLPARLIEDIGALDTKDLYKFISGVADSPYSSTVVRGFTQREVLVNGMKGNPYGSLEGDIANSGFSTSQFRLSNLERVEVLKGPSSVLYGSGEPGGIINYITRKPKDRLETRVTLGTGSFSQGLFEADVTGPLNKRRTLLARGAVYFEERDSFRLNAHTRNTHVVGDLTWRPSPLTSVAFEVEQIDQRNAGHRLRGVPVDATGTFLADYRWTATEPTDFTDLMATVAQARIDQRVGSRGRLDTTFRWLSSERSENYHEPRGITGGGTLMQREFRDQFRSNNDWSLNANLNLPIRTGAVSHDLTVGSEVVSQDFVFTSATARQQSAGGPVQPLSLSSPVYGQAAAAASRYGLTPDRYLTDTAVTKRVGVYAQDLLTLTPRLNLLAGGRVDTYDDTGLSAGRDLAAQQTAATGRVGLVVKPMPRVSLYGTVANGFFRAPILAQTPSANGPHDAERARQVEAGIKTELLGGRAQLTSAVFSIEKDNVLRPDPAFGPTGANTNAVLAVGAIRNRGVEVDLAGALLPRWNLAFNYAFLDSEITRDTNAALVGRRMPNAPTHALGLFTRVDLPHGAALGGSLQYVGDREEPFAGIRAASYNTVDLQFTQQVTPRVRVLLRGENVFDTRYAASSLFVARAGNIPGQPRTISLAVTIVPVK